MPKRTFWLTAGVALGAGSTLWAERRVRRTIEETAAKLAPDALVAEVGRTARHVAVSTGDRFRDAYSEGRDRMHRREEELWSDLSKRGVALPADGTAITAPASGSDSTNLTGVTSGRPTQTSDSERSVRSTRATRATQATRAIRVARAAQRRTTKVARRRPAERSAKSPSHLGN
ncbi:MAG TPA: hypothetical protein VG226_09160 [Acidimicrobiales bacterium]|jgi:hypothetical protein|nr:hypothetical protein [Acidimicrobiales bacterium]